MILFVSDLHLSPERPEVTRLFIDFLQRRARSAKRLYILGDLFEAWLGDDCVLSEYEPVLDALAAVTGEGVEVGVQHGNRDFLLGEVFERRTGCRLLPDPAMVDIHGEPTLIMHGDILCTDDLKYQAMRRQLRDPDWIRRFLEQSPEERLAFARELRAVSEQETGGKAEAIMDVNPEAVEKTMRDHGATRLVHGHTHRPGRHELPSGGERWVLGDWDEDGGQTLVCDPTGWHLENGSRFRS